MDGKDHRWVNIIHGREASWLFDCSEYGLAAYSRSGSLFEFSFDMYDTVSVPVLFHLDDVPVSSGSDYEFSFMAVGNNEAQIKLRFIADGQVDSEYTIHIDKVSQRHRIRYSPSEMADKTGLVRIEFDLNGDRISPVITLSDMFFSMAETESDTRRVIAVCGVWEDADNYNKFLNTIIRPSITKDYVVASFTFTAPYMNDLNLEHELSFARIIKLYDLAAMVLFAEMLKYQEIIDYLIGIAREKNIPVFVIERRVKGTVNGMFNYRSGFEAIVRHVIEDHGITDVRMVAGFKDNQYSLEREDIFKRVMSEHGIAVKDDDIIYGDFYAAKTIRVLESKFSAGMKMPKAFICANDSMATGVSDLIKSMGKRVPEDVIVTGFDGAWCGRYHSPAITTCEPDFEAIGDEIIKVLSDDSIKDYSTLDYVFKMNYKLVINGSCGCHARTIEEWEETVTDLSLAYQDYVFHDSEIGIFITKRHDIKNIDSSVDGIEKSLWLWPYQYFFIGLSTGPEFVHALFRGNSYDNYFKEKFYNVNRPFPEIDQMLRRDSGINVILTRQIRANGKLHGYICTALDKLPLRVQQRYEEFGTYVSTSVESVRNLTNLMVANKQIKSMSELDYLTGLYNRRGFLNLCDKIILDPDNCGKVFTLFSIDMDGLKFINDNFGHAEGDRSLKILAGALSHLTADQGFAARYGGDEFAVAIITGHDISLTKEQIRSRFKDYIARECSKQGLPYSVGASFGLCSSRIDSSINLNLIMKNADEDMYSDKKERKQGRDK